MGNRYRHGDIQQAVINVFFTVGLWWYKDLSDLLNIPIIPTYITNEKKTQNYS